MNKLTIPVKLKQINALQNPEERQKAFTALAHDMGVLTDKENSAAEIDFELERKIKDAYKEYVGQLAVKAGFLLIFLSAINAFVRSCQPG